MAASAGTDTRARSLPRGRPAAAVIVFLVLLTAQAHCLTIKLGSLMPAGSPWDLVLRKLAREWSSLSGGEVETIVYSGGVIGDEDGMVRKMRIGQIHAAGLTIKGVNRIVPGILAVAAPMLYRDDAELDYAFTRMRPVLDAQVEAHGYTVLLWTNVGWVQFLASRPVVRPDDLRGLKMWVWSGDPEEERAWRSEGFQPVVRAATEIMVGLQSRAIQAIAANPVVAAGYQWFTSIPHLSELDWAPFLGAVVIKTETWQKIPERFREPFRARARDAEVELTAAVAEANSAAIAVMRKYGLQTHAVPEAAREEWQAVADHGFGALIGKTFDPATYELARSYVAEYRRLRQQ
jgi:TRAP-type C4-dicarboxylate transport system substrate-binding protein